jgi:hypothetical protein
VRWRFRVEASVFVDHVRKRAQSAPAGAKLHLPPSLLGLMFD